MRVRNLPPRAWGSNCYLLFSGEHAAVVDPSAPAEQILSAISDANAHLDMILLTHGHFDHIISVDTLRDLTGAPVMMHEEDADFLSNSEKNGFSYFFRMNKTYRAPEKTFTNGEILKLGNEEILVKHTPGHTQGSVCFALPDNQLLTGDTLFSNTYGRTDLYGGNTQQLFASLQAMRKWNPNQTIYPGHGEDARLDMALRFVLNLD